MFIKVPNVFTVEGEEKLTSEELYLYYYLNTLELRWYRKVIKTNVELLSSDFTLKKNINQNKNRIKEVLDSLIEKSVFESVEVERDAKGSIKTNSTITIIKKADDYYLNREESFKNGYEQIPYNLFEKVNGSKVFNRADQFLIICYISKVKRPVSIGEWTSILECDKNTVQNKLNDLQERKIINVTSGRYYLAEDNVVRQEMNTYEIAEEQVNEVVKDDSPLNEASETRKHNWYDKDFPTEQCYYIYLTTEDDKLKKHAEKRMKLFDKNNFSKRKRDEGLSYAKNKIAEIERQKEMQLKREEDKGIIHMIEDENKFVIKRDNEYLELNNADNLKMTDSIVSVREDHSNHPIANKELFTESVSGIVNGIYRDDDEFDVRISDKVRNGIFHKLLDDIKTQGTVNRYKIDSYRKELLNEINQDKKYDDDWEGDKYSFSPTSGERNDSLAERKREFMLNVKRDQEQSEKRDALKSNPVLAIFDDEEEFNEDDIFSLD